VPILTVLEVRAEVSTTASDAVVQRWIDAVTDLVEGYVGPVVPRTVTQTVTGYGTVLLEGRVVSVTSVLLNGTAVTDYTLNARAGLLYPAFGSLHGAVVTYTVGFDPIPAAIKQAAMYAVQHAAESVAGAVPMSGQFGGDEVFTLSRGFFLPNRAKELLERYRTPAIA
jgi:hypothetical protein